MLFYECLILLNLPDIYTSMPMNIKLHVFAIVPLFSKFVVFVSVIKLMEMKENHHLF